MCMKSKGNRSLYTKIKFPALQNPVSCKVKIKHQKRKCLQNWVLCETLTLVPLAEFCWGGGERIWVCTNVFVKQSHNCISYLLILPFPGTRNISYESRGNFFTNLGSRIRQGQWEKMMNLKNKQTKKSRLTKWMVQDFLSSSISLFIINFYGSRIDL